MDNTILDAGVPGLLESTTSAFSDAQDYSSSFTRWFSKTATRFTSTRGTSFLDFVLNSNRVRLNIPQRLYFCPCRFLEMRDRELSNGDIKPKKMVIPTNMAKLSTFRKQAYEN